MDVIASNHALSLLMGFLHYTLVHIGTVYYLLGFRLP